MTDKVTQADRDALIALGYTVVDASNPVVEAGWLMRAPGIDDRAWIAATEDDAWQMAYDHSRQARTNTNTELVEALRPFARTDVIEPNGVIIGLERADFARARKALSLYGDER